MRLTTLLPATLLLLSISAFAQMVDEANLSPEEKRERDAVAFLRETQNEVNGLRLVENRISFASELASLIWVHDEREARILYTGVIDDYRQLVSQIDAQMNLLGPKPEGETTEFYSMTEPSDRQKLARKFGVAVTVRASIASSIAERDPEMALTFFYETLGSVSNPDLRKLIAQSDTSLEQRLIDQLAVFDPAKAAQLAKKSVQKGVTTQQVDLLRQMYGKDPDKAADLASTYMTRIKAERPESLDLNALSSLLRYGTQLLDQSRTTTGTRSIYSDAELRDLADVLAQSILARPAEMINAYLSYVRDVERFQPARAAQIRSRAQAQAQSQNRAANARTANTPPTTTFRGPVNASVTGPGTVYAVANSAEQLARVQREVNERRMMDDISRIGNAKISADQREKAVAQLRKTIAATPGKDKKVLGFSALAEQVARSGDKDLANEIMRDAASLVNPQPRNYQDFLLSWMLAAGYSSFDTDRSFMILDDVIGRCNEVLSSAIRVAEFVDTSEEIIVDGELQIGGFASGPGSSMVKALTSSLAGFESVIDKLGKADLQRTRDLTSRFERPEARVLAKMLVLRAVLGNKKSQPKTNPAAR